MGGFEITWLKTSLVFPIPRSLSCSSNLRAGDFCQSLQPLLSRAVELSFDEIGCQSSLLNSRVYD